jgi:hypothetical protein
MVIIHHFHKILEQYSTECSSDYTSSDGTVKCLVTAHGDLLT